MRNNRLIFLHIIAFFTVALVVMPFSARGSNILSSEENLWLKSRNNTIIVYPEKNDPPFSYISAGGKIQGLSIDYIELIAEKVGAKIQYLSPQPRNQLLAEFAEGKGDVITGVSPTSEKELHFIFSDSYITVPTVIVVRKDNSHKKILNLPDLNGQRVSVVSDSSLEAYVRENYPRVVIEDVTDDEVSLQQVVLGEVEAGVMDVASLSYYLSKQVLSSVKIAGNVGYDYEPSFGVSKDKAILQSILDKGMLQISISERQALNEKWIKVPGEDPKQSTLVATIQDNFSFIVLYVLIGLLIIIVLVLVLRKKTFRTEFFKKAHDISSLKEEMGELEKANDLLLDELKEIKSEEEKLVNKIKALDN